MTRGQVLTAVKRMNRTMTSMRAMPLTLEEKVTQVMSFLHSPIQMRGEDANHRPKATSSGRAVTRRSEILTSLSFDLYFLINKQLSALIGFVNNEEKQGNNREY